MKSIFTLAISLLFLTSFSQTDVPSKIESATVFQQGAQVLRRASVSLPKGESLLVFNRLPRSLDPNSVMLSSDKDLNLISISHDPNHQVKLEDAPEMKVLQTKLDKTDRQLEAIASSEHGLVIEREVFEQARQLGGAKGFTLNELKQATDFARIRREKNAAEWYALQNEKAELNKSKGLLQQEMNVLRQQLQQTSSKVFVKVLSKTASQASFSLSYIVPNARWSSAYDARVDDLSKPVKLTHKANIIQNTGEDWTDISLTLATGNPSASAQVPFMGTWFVNTNNVSVQGSAVNKMRNANTFAIADDKDLNEVSIVSKGTQLSQNLTQQEFSIERKQNLKSSNTSVTVVLRELELPAKYEYHAKPRLDPDAFLIAKVYNWGRYDLLDGELSLFNNNTFVGKAFLSTDVPQDTLQLSLGRDKGIVLSRERVYTKQEKTLFGNNRIDHYVWRIELRNNKKLAVDIVLRDQVPVSQSEEIKVSVKSVGGGDYNEKSGIIKWRMRLAPGQLQAYEVAYEVKYPKEQRVMYY
jgi:uncharacterized protein (TIGR02231 family)